MLESCGTEALSALDGVDTIKTGTSSGRTGGSSALESLHHIDVIGAHGCVGRISIGKPIAQSIAGALLGAEATVAALRPLTQLERSALLSLFSTGLALEGSAVWLSEATDRPVTAHAFSAYRLEFNGMAGSLRFSTSSEWADPSDLPLATVALTALDSQDPEAWLIARHQLELEVARLTVADSNLSTLAAGDALFPGRWRDGLPRTGSLFAAGIPIGGANINWLEAITVIYGSKTGRKNRGSASLRIQGPKATGLDLVALRPGQTLDFGGEGGLRLSLYANDRLYGTAQLVEVESRLGVRLLTVS